MSSKPSAYTSTIHAKKLPRSKKVIFTLLTVLIGLIAGVALTRLWDAITDKPEDDTKIVRKADPFLHHTLRPNAAGQLRWGPRLVPYYTNSLGFRDRSCRQISFKSHSNSRTLVIGDSFVEGLGCAYEKTVTACLENLYRRNGKSVEVLNAGVASYSPFLYYRRLRQFFESGYLTDEIIVFLDISDVQDEAAAGYFRMAQNENFPAPSQPKGIFRFFTESRLNPAFWDTIDFQSVEERNRYNSIRSRWTENDMLFKQYGQPGIQRCKENLLRIMDLARSNGAAMKLVLYPWPTQIQSRKSPSRYETIFGDFAREQGIRTMNLVPYFRSLPNWRKYFLKWDVHWNETGHLLVAKELFNAGF